MATGVERTHGLETLGIVRPGRVHWNLSGAALYEAAIQRGEGILAAEGPLVARTGQHTGRAPNDKFIVRESSSEHDIHWGSTNRPMDEAKFDAFIKTLTWEGHVEKIKRPYLVVAGEADELSPLEYTERMIHAMSGPRQLVVYADSRHSVGNVPAANLGPFPPTLVADWLLARLNGKPLKSERWLVEPTGRIVKAAL